MSRTRDIIQEIEDKRRRRKFDSAMLELTMQLYSLEKAFNAQDKYDNELIRYYPVALIACIEGYIRMVIKDLIDQG
ncbi:hypothetical protein ABTM50_21080, partial [Acinetobacter baumannii]